MLYRRLRSKNDSAHPAVSSFFKVVTSGDNILPESLHPIEKGLIQDRSLKTAQHRRNANRKQIERLE
jgi:hypothetical protein